MSSIPGPQSLITASKIPLFDEDNAFHDNDSMLVQGLDNLMTSIPVNSLLMSPQKHQLPKPELSRRKYPYSIKSNHIKFDKLLRVINNDGTRSNIAFDKTQDCS